MRIGHVCFSRSSLQKRRGARICADLAYFIIEAATMSFMKSRNSMRPARFRECTPAAIRVSYERSFTLSAAILSSSCVIGLARCSAADVPSWDTSPPQIILMRKKSSTSAWERSTSSTKKNGTSRLGEQFAQGCGGCRGCVRGCRSCRACGGCSCGRCISWGACRFIC